MSVKKIISKIGLDKAIFFSSSGTLVSAVGNVISAFLIIKFFSAEEQGYYYTFGSIIAIQVFFELGLNGIITQYVAHEMAHLEINSDLFIDGNIQNKSRLSSLLHFCIKWYSTFSIFLVVALIIFGNIFFTKYNDSKNIEWFYPWIFLSISTAFNLLLSPIIAFIQGLGKVKNVAFYQFVAQVFRIGVIFIAIFSGLKLIVLSMGSFTFFVVILYCLLINYGKQLKNIYLFKIVDKVSYLKEIFPYQWKIALSWISGYFIFQLFNPVLFATEGPKVAGQMGLTLAALNGILMLSFSWMSTKIPLFSMYIAKKEYIQLDTVFNLSLKQSLFINFVLLFFFGSSVYLLSYFNIKIGDTIIADRFIPIIPLFAMIFTVMMNHIVSSWATYLRCHKQEPFLINSIVGGVLSAISTIYFGKLFGIIGITLGYLILNILMLPWAYKIFIIKRKAWHYLK